MNSLDSILGGVINNGVLYGWRVDTMLLSGVVWIVITGCQQIRHMVALAEA